MSESVCSVLLLLLFAYGDDVNLLDYSETIDSYSPNS